MLEHYLAALLGLRRAQDLAFSAPPDTPVQPAPADRRAERVLGVGSVPMPAGGSPATTAMAAWPCARSCSPSSTELDAWEAEHGWLYR